MSPDADPRPPVQHLDHDFWRVAVVPEVTSTNTALTERFRAGARAPFALVAEHQSGGRGRLGRDWVVAPGSSLTVSFLLEPDMGAQRWGWLPLLSGVATARAITRSSDLTARLKWPNDVLLEVAGEERKVGGILVERVEHEGRVAAVVGIGVNVHHGADELPVATASSLALAGARTDRTALLAAVLDELAAVYESWRAGDEVRPVYLALCTTPGRTVRVSVPGGDLEGEALGVDDDGRLVVRVDGREQHLGAGDVVHVRTTD